VTDYIHDEWCATKLDDAPDCDCYVQVYRERDALLVNKAQLEQQVKRLEELLKEACHDLENVRMSDTADYLLEQAGLEEKEEA